MACILHIETSTDLCSVAVSQDGAVIYSTDSEEAARSEATPGGVKHTSNHAGTMGTLIDDAMSFTDSHAIPFDAVAVSNGPGSYTGLRIGVSLAKGVCYGGDLKLIALPTLQVLCVPFLLRYDDIEEDALVCPMLDARRMEVYTALYTRALRPVQDVAPMVIDADSFKEQLDKHPIYFFGNGAAKCKEVIKHPNAHFVEGIQLHAKYMAPLAERKFLQEDFADVAYLEPDYLKDFVATKAKDLL